MRTEILREKTRGLVNIISKPFIWMRFTPNMISSLGIVTVVLFFPFLKWEYYYLAALMILLNGVFDLIDGAVARATGKSSMFGKFLDRTFDKISDAAIMAGYIVFGLVSLPLGLYALITMFLATNVSANIEGVLNFKISDAFSLRFLRIIILILLTILGEFEIMFWILAAIATYSLVQRFGTACYRYFKKK